MACGRDARFYFMNNLLSIFIDESGDFGKYEFHSPYYIISMVFHEQNKNIKNNITIFEEQLSNIGFSNHCIHSGPIIRGEEEYRNIDINIRKSLFRKVANFIRNLDVQYKCFYIEKKHIKDDVEAAGKLSKQISTFIKSNLSYFLGFDEIIVYYDNGQTQLNKILISIFNAFFDTVEFRKVAPANYRLFQVADFMCTLKMLELKFNDKKMSRSEFYFFDNAKVFKKQYLKYLNKKELI